MVKKRIKQIIVVEGKTDTQKLKKIFGPNLQTIETNGLKVTNQLLTFLNQINENLGIIVFTDPDGPGKKIREKINQKMDGEVLNAFITSSDIQKKKKKIGIAEAKDEAIVAALNHLIVFTAKKMQTLDWSDYLKNEFYLKASRQKIAQHFGWSADISSKTLFKWLNWIQMDAKKIQQILEK